MPDLYREQGIYSYRHGVNRRALAALVAGVLAALTGTLHPALAFLFRGAWFTAAFVAFTLYYLLMRAAPYPLTVTSEA